MEFVGKSRRICEAPCHGFMFLHRCRAMKQWSWDFYDPVCAEGFELSYSRWVKWTVKKPGGSMSIHATNPVSRNCDQRNVGSMIFVMWSEDRDVSFNLLNLHLKIMQNQKDPFFYHSSATRGRTCGFKIQNIEIDESRELKLFWGDNVLKTWAFSTDPTSTFFLSLLLS